jgi:hypothetical protein
MSFRCLQRLRLVRCLGIKHNDTQYNNAVSIVKFDTQRNNNESDTQHSIGDDISLKISNVKLNIINVCNLIMLAI